MLCVILVCVIISPTFSARILGVAPVPFYSHQIAFRPIWRELSLRGHEVTVITTDPMNNPSLMNLTEIDINFAYKMWNEMSMFNISQNSVLTMLTKAVDMIIDISDEIFQQSDVQRLIKNESEHFDLVMGEYLAYTSAFAERFKCPGIGISSMDGLSVIYEAIGNPIHPVVYPDNMLPYSGEMTFLERLVNVLCHWIIKYTFITPLLRAQDSLIQKHFGEDYPSVFDMLKNNVSMVFVNTDPIFHQIRPHLPSVVQFGGGTHLSPPKPLPKDLQRTLDNATQGFIYFSLGSNVKSKELPETTRCVILETLSELPYLVLWKFEVEDLPGKPDNVIISKWFPQQDILRHPHLKLFITHGGQQSMEEAVYSHIPLVGMPFVGDQLHNVKKFVSKGFGLAVDQKSLDKHTFKSTIVEVITNPKYRNRIKELAELVKDQPMTGLERAIWWTEYVLRHKGAQHLRSPAADLPLYQYLLLDVIGFCLLLVAIAIYLIVIIIKFLFKILQCFNPKKKVKIQ